jgi:hypothetical protein
LAKWGRPCTDVHDRQQRGRDAPIGGRCVGDGGYTNASYWRFPIIEAGKEISLAAARARFTDSTLIIR